MKVEFEMTDDARVLVTVDGDHRAQVSHLSAKPPDAEWEQLQRVLLRTFKGGMQARSREFLSILRKGG